MKIVKENTVVQTVKMVKDDTVVQPQTQIAPPPVQVAIKVE